MDQKPFYEKYRVERLDGKPVGRCLVIEIGEVLDSIEAFRDRCDRHGLVCLPRDPSDPKCVVETWL